jgi:hypothetical protein
MDRSNVRPAVTDSVYSTKHVTRRLYCIACATASLKAVHGVLGYCAVTHADMHCCMPLGVVHYAGMPVL